MEKMNARLLWILGPLLLVGQFSSCGSGAIVASARDYQESVARRVEEARLVIDEAKQAFSQAKRVHNPAYLEGKSLEAADEMLREIDGFMEIASGSNNPSRIRDAAYRASLLTRQAAKPAEDLKAYVQFLDEALANYMSEPVAVSNQILDVENAVRDYVEEGYFPKHFDVAGNLLQSSREHNNSAVGLGKVKVWEDLPDYKQAYEVCLLARSKASQALASAQAVPALRADNYQRIASLEKQSEQMLGSYTQAKRSAQNLEMYPAYRCLKAVEQARASLSLVETKVNEARALNDMSVQEFVSAKLLVDGVGERISSAKSVYNQAVNNWEAVLTAINQFDDIERQAKRAISNAASRINSYDHNSQITAQGYLADARAYLREGQRLEVADPPKAVAQLRLAKNAANDAYDSVDTSSDDDDSSIYIGTSSGGSSGYDYGSSSGGYGGGSYGGSSGGYGGGSDSFSSGPSGSYSSGPSGSFGDGGF
jgi:hypothetical protein